ncbi:MAC/perforin domain protein (macronuclear) [Tetrahymena thermophila SB210]|uniref:MAC/perforin domain protein n=1 Tax=Tetrahymena thermophila (strain SB210) TaxID=312017 RepID=Q22CA7_TETTS|nr:MAC/perforin domain protein [Tetrahymena thermophila SB210]EAR82900.1 MAC/perforin domain protein [Tetrahymena thermophila SB210]|eukprot:XP_001030563.1 MAC/perforin domain protein [Tetrahymena thermophila SB210]
MNIFKTKFTICLLLVLQIICAQQSDQTISWKQSISPGQIKYIPNVSYLGQGYNIFQGNPLSTSGIDPGFRNVPAVDLLYQDNLWDAASPDRAYFIPDGVRVNIEKSCLITFSSKQVSTLTDYQNSLSAKVSGKGSVFSASFSASADFKQMKDTLSQKDTQCIQSHATCTAFDLSFYNDINSLPLLSLQLVDKIQQLYSYSNYTNEKEYYYDFFDSWGTHVATSVRLGSLFGYQFKMSSSSVQQQSSLGFDASVGASLYGVKGKVSTSYAQQQLNSFQQSLKSWSSYSLGATPNANLDAAQWATQTLDTPMPIKTELTPIYTFISQYQNNADIPLNSTTMAYVVNAMQNYIGQYCYDRLQFSTALNSCSGYVNQSSDPYVGQSKIMNTKSGKFVSFDQNTLKVFQLTNNSTTSNQQMYTVTRPTNNQNIYQIQTSNYNYCLGVSVAQDGQPLVLKNCALDSLTLFEIDEIGQGFQYLKLMGSNYYMTVQSTASISDTSDNALIVLSQNQNACRGCTFFQVD